MWEKVFYIELCIECVIVCVRMYVCEFVCLFECVHLCVYVRFSLSTYVYMCVHLYVS